ncbi:MAG: hypothetical protein VZS44_10105, partial [Bacilli bacterium]|nr:hypothetical protein [Bacilli bacterium]
ERLFNLIQKISEIELDKFKIRAKFFEWGGKVQVDMYETYNFTPINQVFDTPNKSLSEITTLVENRDTELYDFINRCLDALGDLMENGEYGGVYGPISEYNEFYAILQYLGGK